MKQLIKRQSPTLFRKASRVLAKSIIASTLLFGHNARADQVVHTKFANLSSPKHTIEQVYNYGGKCAGYATRMAKSIFGYNYNRNEAWLLGRDNKVIVRAPFSRTTREGSLKKEQVERLIDLGTIKPGYLLGCYSPNSSYKDTYDVTHTALYVGKDSHNTPIFWHNFGKKGQMAVKKETLDTLYKTNNGVQRVYIIEVIAPAN